MTEPDDRSYSTAEVAVRLGSAGSTVLHYARRLFPHRFRPGTVRAYRFTADEVEQLRRFAEQQRQAPQADDGSEHRNGTVALAGDARPDAPEAPGRDEWRPVGS